MRWWVFFLLHAGLLVAAVALAGASAHPAWLVAMGGLSAFAMVQVGYAGHDLAHGQCVRGRRARRMLGLVCWNLLLGVSLAYWRDRHGRHHLDTHVPGRDPDLFPLFAHGEGAAATRSRLHRAFLRRTPWLFWVATAFARAHYLVFGALHVARLRGRERLVEAALLAAHHVAFVGGAWVLLGPRAVAFVLVNLAVSGLYMGLAFATNHLGMPYAAMPPAGSPGRAWQAAHTRNVRTGRIGDYLLGGLNHQIEHHLRPTLPRPHLRAFAPEARAACGAAGAPYHSVGLWQALCEVQRGLRDEARQVAP